LELRRKIRKKRKERILGKLFKRRELNPFKRIDDIPVPIRI
jgi:hypothetical protein